MLSSLFNRHILLLSLFLLSVSCSDSDDENSDEYVSGHRVVFFYFAAENDLYSFLSDDIDEILSASKCLGDDDRLVIFVDDLGKPRIYEVDNTVVCDDLNSLTPVHIFAGEFNSCGFDGVCKVFDFFRSNYHADSYGLVMCSHGTGWLPSTYDGDKVSSASKRKTFGVDNGKNYSLRIGNQLDITDLASAINLLPHLDFLMFDACYMQCAEVLYELKDNVDVIISSCAEIPGDGAPYSDIMQYMFSDTVDADNIVNKYYEKSYGWISDDDKLCGVVLSAVYTDGFDSLYIVTKNLYERYQSVLADVDLSDVSQYADGHIKTFGFNVHFYDLRDLFRHILPTTEFVRWNDCLNRVICSSRVSSVIYSDLFGAFSVNHEECCGISVTLPVDLDIVDEYYRNSYGELRWNL